MKTTEEKIVKLNNKTQEIINRDDLEWEQKYDKIFSDKISRKVQKLIRLDYYDPDTSYEEDVMAFASALNEWVANEA
jgi:hypothetical protein